MHRLDRIVNRQSRRTQPSIRPGSKSVKISTLHKNLLNSIDFVVNVSLEKRINNRYAPFRPGSRTACELPADSLPESDYTHHSASSVRSYKILIFAYKSASIRVICGSRFSKRHANTASLEISLLPEQLRRLSAVEHALEFGAADGDVAFVAADLDLGAFGQGVAVVVDAHDHGGFLAAGADRL